MRGWVLVFGLLCSCQPQLDCSDPSYASCCTSSHTCVNGDCVCETEGLEGEPCTDDEVCESECEVCTGDDGGQLVEPQE
jgi:hypothetical protein